MKSPDTLALIAGNIPEDLAAFDNWVPWRWEHRNDRWTKAPLNAATGKRASSTNPSTWTTFESAVRYARRNALPGVGFVFTDSPFAGVDLDDCREPETGHVEPWAAEIVATLDSYTEVSPSGTGLKVFVCGTLPLGGRRKGDIEMYDTGRFFTVTGRRLSEELAPISVMQRTEALAALHRRVFGDTPKPRRAQARPGPEHALGGVDLDDAEIITRATAAGNGAKFVRLWNGDTGGYGGSGNEGRSEADLALCSMLAFWTGPDEERIDALFRHSGLMRPKWDERHYGDGRTYGRGTIGKALAGRVEFFELPRPSRSKARRVWRGAARV